MSKREQRHWQISSQSPVFQGFYRIEQLEFSHQMFDGTTSKVVQRELFMRGDVTAVIAHDPELDKLALVEQFRIGAMNQHPDPWLIEIIAGMVEPGETPEQVAVREAREEAGIELRNVQLARRYLASPGSTNEEVHIFVAEADLANAGGVHGLDEEDEDIRVHVVDVEQAFDMLDRGIIKNAISIIALQWLRHHRLTTP